MKLFGRSSGPNQGPLAGKSSLTPMSELAMKNTRGGDASDDDTGDDDDSNLEEEGSGGTGDDGLVGTYNGGPEGFTPGVIYPIGLGIWFNGQYYTFPYEDFPFHDLPDPGWPDEEGNELDPEWDDPNWEPPTGEDPADDPVDPPAPPEPPVTPPEPPVTPPEVPVNDHPIYTGGDAAYPIGKIVLVDDGVWFNGEHFSWPFEDFPVQDLPDNGDAIYSPGEDPLDGLVSDSGNSETSADSTDTWDDGVSEGDSEFFAMLFEAGFEPPSDIIVDDV